MKPQFFKLAEKLAQKSNHPDHKHGAVLVLKNKVIGVGFNQAKTHPKAPHGYKHIHAEFSAILNSGLESFEGCEMYVVRKRKTGPLALSKPCQSCANMLSSLGVYKVHYSIDALNAKTEEYQ